MWLCYLRLVDLECGTIYLCRRRKIGFEAKGHLKDVWYEEMLTKARAPSRFYELDKVLYQKRKEREKKLRPTKSTFIIPNVYP